MSMVIGKERERRILYGYSVNGGNSLHTSKEKKRKGKPELERGGIYKEMQRNDVSRAKGY